MVLSKEKRQATLEALAESEGFDDIQGLLEAAAYDSVSPGICINCDYTCEVEPDQDKGYCEACGGQSVQSALVPLARQEWARLDIEEGDELFCVLRSELRGSTHHCGCFVLFRLLGGLLFRSHKLGN